MSFSMRSSRQLTALSAGVEALETLTSMPCRRQRAGVLRACV